MKHTTFAACLVLALSGVADAEPKTSSAKPKPAAKTKKKTAKSKVKRRAKQFDFTAATLEGARLLPDTERVVGRGNLKHKSLIRYRQDFLSAIFKSAESL